MAYAAGNLPEAFNLIVATHVSLCDECRAVVESYDGLGGGAIIDEYRVAECVEPTVSRRRARPSRPDTQ